LFVIKKVEIFERPFTNHRDSLPPPQIVSTLHPRKMDGDTRSKRRRVDAPGQQLSAAGEKRAVLRGKLTSAFQTTVTEAF
jgi:hypothetical protein